ncbi:chemotaxis protein CheB [Dactylosporangium sp. CA-139066]|uniref:chemotaxis protein CheB n=1 Tax=Dactylosporangium sp. CA-139066 TaxID=3239930 RepID=UPI003D8FD96E
MGTAVDVVALVASAGGLGALTTVLRGLPADLEAAVVVQQHLAARSSALPQVLARRTGRAVAVAADGDRLTPGAVLVCPPRRHFEVLPDGTCALMPSAGARERPHDALLVSLADSYGPRALAVVLTGMLNDGAAGTAALKAAGGMVIAQSEDTAEQPSMPRAAAEAGADLVLPLHEIGPAIASAVRGGRLPRASAEDAAVRELFRGTTTMESIARDIDWSKTPLGPVAGWDPTLRTMVALVMAAPKPLNLLWGGQHILLYNDAAIEPSGAKHPEQFARSSLETWAEARPILGPLYDRVMRGETVYRPDSEGLVQRRGRPELAWFDVSYTPVRGEDGAIVGILQASHERTAEVLAARRLQVLNRLATTPASSGRRAALEAALAVLGDAPDVAFAVAYLLDAAGTRAGLVGAVGVEPGGSLAPRDVRVAVGGAWPLQKVVAGRAPVVVDDVAARFRGHLVGPERLAPDSAALHPLRDEAEDTVAGVLVLGTHPRLPVDGPYREFLSLIAETVTAKVAESHARQRERQRLERLAELDRAKTEFFTSVSHEFRTPLTLMLAPLEELLRHPERPTEERLADVDLVHRNARRLLRLVGALLDFSAAEAGRLRAAFAPTDLAALTAEIAVMFAGAADAAGLRLVIDAPPLPEPVWVDAQMWEKVVSNLLSNALKFTWQGTVEVRLRALPQHAELVVRDTGVGIPSAEVPLVFQRFHRVPRARARTSEGAGIGLALVEQLVRLHHGRIRVSSVEGAGTTFTVWLPLSRRPAAAEAPGPSPRTGSIAAAMAGDAARWDAEHERAVAAQGVLDPAEAPALPRRAPGARVLVVEDNADMRDYLGRLLGEAWTVTAAPDGEQALRLARAAPFDIVVADVMMPAPDGFALLSAIRGDEALAHVPVVLVTARAGEESAIEGLLAGADDYIVKPFSARELVARVGAQLELARLRRRTARRQAVLLRLSDVLRPLGEPLEVQTAAARVLGEHLAAARVTYGEVAPGGTHMVTGPGYVVTGRPNPAGRYRMADFGVALLERLAAGETVVVADVSTDPRLLPAEREALAGLGVAAMCLVPLIKRGRFVSCLGVQHAEAYAWPDDEVALVREVAERTWAEVERSRAQQRLALVFQALPVGVAVVDASGAMLLANEHMRRYVPTGVIPSSDPSRVARWQGVDADGTVVAPSDFPVARALRGDTVVPGLPMRYTADDGTQAWTLIASAPIRDRAGHVTGAFALVIDIDQLKKG